MKTYCWIPVLMMGLLARGSSDIVPERIINGYKTHIKQYPFVVSVLHGSEICGGSIIAAQWILSAAHCKASFIRYGRTTGNKGVTASVQKKYDFADISLLFLAEKLEFSEVVQPVKLPAKDYDIMRNEKVNLTVLGWGVTAEFRGTSKNLQKAVVVAISNQRCQSNRNLLGRVKLSNFMLCAISLNQWKGHCDGDSGGPGVADDGTQLGVVSFTIRGSRGNCGGPERATIFMKVATFMHQIERTTGCTRDHLGYLNCK